jgi:hypothetical protein
MPVKLPLISIGKENIVFTDSLGQKIPFFEKAPHSSVNTEFLRDDLYYIKFTFLTDESFLVKNIEIPIQFLPDSNHLWEQVKKSFHWIPNLKQSEDHIFSQHVFRSPCIILSGQQNAVSIIPDVFLLGDNNVAPYYLDLRFKEDGVFVYYGLSKYNVKGHVFYEKSDSLFPVSKKIEIGIYVIFDNEAHPDNILKKTNSLLWSSFGERYRESILPQVLPFNDYAERGYNMAFEKYWVNGPVTNTGGITLSTFYDKDSKTYRGRSYKDDIWYHSWFNNVRTAYGLYYWGLHSGNKNWQNRALNMVNLLMESPVKKGFFSTIWVPENNQWISSGQGGGEGLYHLPDNVWTAYWLMRFNDELEQIPKSESFLNNFMHALIKTQNRDGSFPARIHTDNFTPDSILRSSASSAIVTWFLEEMIIRGKLSADEEKSVKESVVKSLDFLKREVLPLQKFEDFELYFSCSKNPVGYFDSNTFMYPQNTLSIQWCAEAFLKAYKIFGDKKYLLDGEYCLNILSLYQQVWNPPYISLYAFGGFGVQNTDAEWSDARQAQFAETYLSYYFTTRNIEYLQRGVAACRASFALMAIPENKEICPFNYQGHIINGEFTGAMAENYGHSGLDRRSYQSGFHWGTGSALTTAAIFKKKLGDLYIDDKLRTAIGVNGIEVTSIGWDDAVKIETVKLPGLTDTEIKSSNELLVPLWVDGEQIK